MIEKREKEREEIDMSSSFSKKKVHFTTLYYEQSPNNPLKNITVHLTPMVLQTGVLWAILHLGNAEKKAVGKACKKY